MISALPGVLGIFPALSSFGGVQASGRNAWRGIVNQLGPQRARLFSYASGASKTRSALRALWSSDRADLLLVWHVHLLKLVPVLNGSATRVVVFLHGIEAWKRHDFLTQWMLRRVHLFLSNSDHTWERFLSFNPHFRNAAHQVVHLGSGAHLHGPIPDPRQHPVALMVGRMRRSEDYKGHREMIEAWPLILQRLPEAHLWIVGDGDLQPDLERLALTRGLDRHVRFWGPVSDAEKERLIAECRCLALPSRGEGFGLVYLEAMRMGRPCLVSDIDAGREVVNPPEAGLAADPGNPQHVAEAACRLLTPGPEWSRWSVQARHRFETRFTEQQFHKRLLAAMFES